MGFIDYFRRNLMRSQAGPEQGWRRWLRAVGPGVRLGLVVVLILSALVATGMGAAAPVAEGAQSAAPTATAPLHILNPSSGIWPNLWITHCMGDGRQRVWQVTSDVHWAEFRGVESEKDCGPQGNFGMYPLVFRNSTLTSSTWVTWCTGNGSEEWVWRSDGSYKYVPFQYPQNDTDGDCDGNGGGGGDGDFVSASGTTFRFRGSTYKFIGVNLRGVTHRGGGEIDEQLRAASSMNSKVIRVFVAHRDINATEAGNRLENLIHRAQSIDARFKVIVVFTDWYKASNLWVQGDSGWYHTDPWGNTVLHPDWFRGGFREHYKPFVGTLVDRFEDEPTIFAWELGNELQAASADDMLHFTYEMGNYIEDLGARQMVTTGFKSTHHAVGGNYSGRSLEAVMDDVYVNWNGQNSPMDFLTVHGYGWGSDPIEWNHGRPDRIDRGLDWGGGRVPYVMEEIGFTGAGGPGPVFDGDSWDGIWLDHAGSSREPATRKAVDHFFNDLAADGVMQWGFMVGGDNGEGDTWFGMDHVWHSDWNALYNYYRNRGGSLPGNH